jgi:hypothetical protein
MEMQKLQLEQEVATDNYEGGGSDAVKEVLASCPLLLEAVSVADYRSYHCHRHHHVGLT